MALKIGDRDVVPGPYLWRRMSRTKRIRHIELIHAIVKSERLVYAFWEVHDAARNCRIHELETKSDAINAVMSEDLEKVLMHDCIREPAGGPVLPEDVCVSDQTLTWTQITTHEFFTGTVMPVCWYVDLSGTRAVENRLCMRLETWSIRSQY